MTTTDFTGIRDIWDVAGPEGWSLTGCCINGTFEGMRIERNDEMARFEDDTQAWAFVVDMACKGSRVHFEALRHIAAKNHAEYACICKRASAHQRLQLIDAGLPPHDPKLAPTQ